MMTRSAGQRMLLAVGCAVAVYAGGINAAKAQQSPQGRAGGRDGGMSSALLTAIDANKDGTATREELKTRFDSRYTAWDTSKTNALAPEQR